MKNSYTFFKKLILCSLAALATTPNYGNIFFVVSFNDGSIQVYKQQNDTFEPILTAKSNNDLRSLRSIAISKNQIVATAAGSQLSGVSVWENTGKTLHRAQTLYTMDLVQPFPTSVIFGQKGILASGFSDGTMRIWKQKKNGQFELTQELDENSGCHTDFITSVVCNKNGSLISISRDKTIKVWKQEKSGQFKLEQTFDKRLVHRLSFVAFDTTKFLASAKDSTITHMLLPPDADDSIKIWKLNKNNQFDSFQKIENHCNDDSISLTSILLNENGSLIAGYSSGIIKIWTQEKNGHFQLRQTLDQNSNSHATKITSMALNPEGLLLSGSDKGVLKIWGQKGGQFKHIQTFDSLTKRAIKALAFMPSKKTVDPFKTRLKMNKKYKKIKIITCEK